MADEGPETFEEDIVFPDLETLTTKLPEDVDLEYVADVTGS